MTQDPEPISFARRPRVASVVAALLVVPLLTTAAAAQGTPSFTDPPLLPGSSKKPRQYRIVPPPVYPGAPVAFPQLDRFVRGEPRTQFQPGTVYVLEFFSTTCSHCEEAAPIVEELVRTFAPKGFEFIAVTTEDEPKVRAWLEKPEIAERIKHSVACDPDQSALKALQFGTYRNSSPRFFVLKDGKVLWYGHPNISEGPLKQIADGTWNPDSIRAEFIVESIIARAKEQTGSLAKECEKNGRWNELFELYDSIAFTIPDRASQFELQKFGTMISSARMPVEGYRYGREVAAKYPKDIVVARTLARTTLSAPKVEFRDLDFGMEMALVADRLGEGKDARAAELLALACFSKGDREKAIEHQTRAVELQTEPKLKRTYQQALARYRTAAPGPINATGIPASAPATGGEATPEAPSGS